MSKLRTLFIAAILAPLAACSSFKMGTAVFIPHGQYGTVIVGPTPEKPAQPATPEAVKPKVTLEHVPFMPVIK